MTKANAFNRRQRDVRSAVLWDGHELSRRLWRNPSVADRYFGSRIADGKQRFSVTRSILSAVRPRYASFDLQGFPERGRSPSIDADIDSAITELKAGKITTVIIEGGIGSGKTGLAAALARELGFINETLRFTASYDYLRILFAQYHTRDREFLESLKNLISAPCLIIDDFVKNLGATSEPRQFAMDSLTRVVDARQAEGRPTLISIYSGRALDRNASSLIAKLKAAGASISLGHEDLRGGPRRDVDLCISSGREILSRGWLLEKLENTERSIQDAIDICSTPDDVYTGRQKRIEILHAASPLRKEEEIRFVLDGAKRDLRGWSAFIASFPFEGIEVDETGKVQLRPSRRDAN